MRHLTALLAIPLLATGAGCSAETAAIITSTGAVSIIPFDDCQDLRDYFVQHALDVVGPYGLGGGEHHDGIPLDEFEMGSDDSAAEAGDSAGGLSANEGAMSSVPEQRGDFSGTNNQEKGVDEADRVKTDGSIIAVVEQNRLQIVDAASAEVVSSMSLGKVAPGAYDAELLLNGDTLLVLSSGAAAQRPTWSQWPEWDGEDSGGDFVEDMEVYGHGGATRTTIARLDISNPAQPEVLGSTRVEGSYRSARMISDSVRLVIQSEPTGPRFTRPRNGSLFAERDATDANRKVIEDSRIDDWVPHLEVIDAGESRGDVQPLTDCADVNRPGDFSGLSTLTVLTLDASSGAQGKAAVAPTSTVSLVASGETVYASTDRLIVATSPWGRWATPFTDMRPGGEVSTALHSFDISDPERTDYVASGRVRGTLVNQFALSERDGVIRVATTSEAAWGNQEDSESALVMLTEDGNRLVLTGVVDGLGVSEQIKSVRYLSPDLAAIVTFRQTDPLYLVDTSDPTAPVVTGELKIPGYSAYLHPVGEDYLLGVGQEADPQSGMEEGLQASLFDISDLSDPRRVDQLTWPGGYSPVEWDHRAFTAWAQSGQFFLPAEIYDANGWECEDEGGDDEVCAEPDPRDEFGGVVTGTIEGDALEMGPRLPTQEPGSRWSPPADRTLVIDGNLWTVHAEGMNRYDLESLDGGPALTWPTADSSSEWSE